MHKVLIYLHIIHVLKCSTCFERYPAHLQEVYVVIVYMQPLVSSLSAGDCLVHRLRKNSLDDWLTVHRSIPWLISNLMHKILIYLHIIHLLKCSTCFERYPAHLQEVYVVIVYMQPLVSSLSAGDCLVHRLRKNSLDDWLTVHRSIPWLISNLMHKILIYLHIIHLLKSSTCFEHYPAHLQEVYVVIVYMQLLVSSL